LEELFTINQENEADIEINESIVCLPDWKNIQPPILIPEAITSKENLLGILFAKLSNYENAYPLLAENQAILQAVDKLNRLQNGIAIDQLESEINYFNLHNNAIIQHYGYVENAEYENLEATYQEAINTAPNYNYKAFTTYHYAQWLLDFGQINKADEVLKGINQESLSPLSASQITYSLCQAQIKQLTAPYDENLLETAKANLWKCLQYFEEHNFKVEAAMVWNDAAHIAAISNSFAEALGYSTKAIAIYEEEQLQHFKAQAQLTQANLLLMWAQNGSPQFYKQAIDQYKNALAVYTRTDAPDVFANIHHQLGIIYAEIPEEIKKKSVWAAVSVSSFTEAMQYFTKADYPYEYASICHSQGNAFTKYPIAIHSDNYEKALAWYNEALEIRTAQNYPLERVLTLCNYLEASWFVGNKEAFDEDRYNDMLKVANEILSLTTDESIIEHTKADIEKLHQIKKEAIA
jgi:tetratricopeptide (TPR) repeat protein